MPQTGRTASIFKSAVTSPISATGSGSAQDMRGTQEALCLLDVTAVSGSGSPTLTLRVQGSVDGATNWTTLGTFAAVTAAGSQEMRLVGGQRYMRADYTVSGTTPSFTCVLHFVALSISDTTLGDAV